MTQLLVVKIVAYLRMDKKVHCHTIHCKISLGSSFDTYFPIVIFAVTDIKLISYRKLKQHNSSARDLACTQKNVPDFTSALINKCFSFCLTLLHSFQDVLKTVA